MTTTITKRKVLFFVPTFPVLTETFILGEIKKLAERGSVEVKVLSLDGDRDKLPEILKDKVIYKRLSPASALLGIVFGLSRMGKVKKAVNLLAARKTSLGRKTYLVIKYLGYSKIISNLKPDILVAHFMSEPSTLGMFVSTMLDLPYGISAHAKDVTVTAEYIREKTSTAKFVLICNKNAQKYLIGKSSGNGLGKIILQYHGVDVKSLSCESTDGAKANLLEKPTKPLIVSVGRLTEKKGHRYLIEASGILKKRGVDHLIYIIGPGPLFKEITSKIAETGVSDNVKILGEGNGLPFVETIKHLRTADVGVFTGIKTEEGDEDGIPNVLVEYASLHLPIVSTDAGSATDFIENEITGLLVPQKNPHLLADAIERLLFDKKLCEVLTANAYIKADSDFNINNNVVELEKILLTD